jgi:hypothetical protein
MLCSACHHCIALHTIGTTPADHETRQSGSALRPHGSCRFSSSTSFFPALTIDYTMWLQNGVSEQRMLSDLRQLRARDKTVRLCPAADSDPAMTKWKWMIFLSV